MKATYEDLQESGEIRQRRTLSSKNRIMNGSARLPENLIEKLKNRLRSEPMSSLTPKKENHAKMILKRKVVDIVPSHMLSSSPSLKSVKEL